MRGAPPRSTLRSGPGLAGLALALACARGPAGPAPLDTRNETCGSCRMAIVEARFAAQITAPGEEPRFFDDLGCLSAYLARSRSLPEGATAWVADHRTGEWARAAAAVYTLAPGLETPMMSHWIAHADAASRDADPAARGGAPLSRNAIFGPAGPPDAAGRP